MKVPIIILNYNSSSDCKKCFSYLQQQIGVDLDIIIVDNCSQADDIKEVEQFSAENGITLLKSNVNNGFSAGNNIGLRYAEQRGYEYALILNPDMELRQSDYILSLLDVATTDKTIAVIGSDIITPEGVHQNPMREATYWEQCLWVVELIKKKIKGSYTYQLDYKHSGYCEKLSGCCFLISIPFLKSVGFMDENTFLYCEEPILAKQVQQKNMKLYFLATSQAHHVHIKSSKGDPSKRMELFHTSRIYYWQKYSGYSAFQIKLLRFSYQVNLSLMKLANQLKKRRH